MTIYDYRTFVAPMVLPPKPQAKAIAPKMTMAETARRENAAAAKRDGHGKFGFLPHERQGRAAGYITERSQDRRKAIIAAMRKGDVTLESVAKLLGCGQSTASKYMRDMIAEGIATRTVYGGGRIAQFGMARK